jgi:sulfur relay (sulfurtransferase) DsrC/TusE family protein
VAQEVQIQLGSAHWKHSELFFEKKQLIPALQMLLSHAPPAIQGCCV